MASKRDANLDKEAQEWIEVNTFSCFFFKLWASKILLIRVEIGNTR